MYHQKRGGNVSFRKKKQNAYPCKFKKKLKMPPFHCHQKNVDQ